MWTNILDFMLNILSFIGEIANWLFTPININVVSEGLDEFYTSMNKAGLSNVPTWVYKLFENASEPIYVTPIGIFSVGFLTTIFVWALVKSIWSN